MPKQKDRGKVLKTRTVSLPGGKYKRCDIYSKSGPRGGKTVCGPTRKKKTTRR